MLNCLNDPVLSYMNIDVVSKNYLDDLSLIHIDPYISPNLIYC